MPALDTIELSSSALKSGEDPTALRKKIVRSKLKRAEIYAAELDRLLKTDYFKDLKSFAEKNEELKDALFTYAMYQVEQPDVEKGKKQLFDLLNQEQTAWRWSSEKGKTK